MTAFQEQRSVPQHDSAPAHKAKTTQEWLRRNAWEFHLSSGSLDVNPLDYKLWSELQNVARRTAGRNLNSPMRALAKAASQICSEAARATVPDWSRCL
ncbi:hypothetical protein KM043_005108 [Ampulex compressa]|nr:hypothetical protein KM043_005108 [Ampulex compressa]